MSLWFLTLQFYKPTTAERERKKIGLFSRLPAWLHFELLPQGESLLCSPGWVFPSKEGFVFWGVKFPENILDIIFTNNAKVGNSKAEYEERCMEQNWFPNQVPLRKWKERGVNKSCKSAFLSSHFPWVSCLNEIYLSQVYFHFHNSFTGFRKYIFHSCGETKRALDSDVPQTPV